MRTADTGSAGPRPGTQTNMSFFSNEEEPTCSALSCSRYSGNDTLGLARFAMCFVWSPKKQVRRGQFVVDRSSQRSKNKFDPRRGSVEGRFKDIERNKQ